MAAIAVSVTLLVMLAALYFLSKVQRENSGALIKYTTYFILLVASVMLLFQLTRVTAKVWHRKMCKGAECTSMHHGKMKSKGMHGGKNINACCCAEMDCTDHCSAGGMMDCCTGKPGKRKLMRSHGQGVIRESSVDTVDGKIIMKETEIIERKE